MSFWETSDGEDVTKTATKEYDAGGGGFDIIPAKTNCLALLHSAAWKTDEKSGSKFINIRWNILEDKAYAGRVVFQKLWVKKGNPNPSWNEGEEDKKRTSQLKMFASIDANAKGKLARKNDIPDNDDLAMALAGSEMMIRLMVWDKDEEDGYGNKKKVPGGNWVSAVGPKGGEMNITRPSGQERKPEPSRSREPDNDLDDDDVPF